MAIVRKEEIEEAVREGYPPDEIAELEEDFQKTESLIAKIHTAFAGVTLGDGIGLWESDARDGCLDLADLERPRLRDERESWQKIPEADIESCTCATSPLCFTDAEGFRFLVPALMIGALTYCPDNDSTLINLCLYRDECDKSTLLNATQLETIVEFLELQCNDFCMREEIAEVLERFWIPRLEKAKTL